MAGRGPLAERIHSSMSTPENRPVVRMPKVHWYQFSLRGLLLFMTASALVCAWLVKCIEAEKERVRKALSPVTSQADWPTEIHDFLDDGRPCGRPTTHPESNAARPESQ